MSERKENKTLSEWCLKKTAELEAEPQSDWAKWKGNRYAERLFDEWTEHGKIVLAVDFDDTIFPWKFNKKEDQERLIKCIKVIQLCQQIGCYTSIWSACSPDRYNEIYDFCSDAEIKVSSINENPIKLPYGNHKKMYYNHLLDDRAGLESAISMLEYVCYRVQCARSTSASENFDI